MKSLHTLKNFMKAIISKPSHKQILQGQINTLSKLRSRLNLSETELSDIIIAKQIRELREIEAKV